MNNYYLKDEIESIFLKNVDIKIKKNPKQLIINSKILFLILILLIISFVYIYKINIKKRDNIIKDLNKQLDNIFYTQPKYKINNPQKQTIKAFNGFGPLEKAYLYDMNFFKYNNMFSNESKNRIGYNIIYYTHGIEKGLSHFVLRNFGEKKIYSLINLLKKYLKFFNYENDFSFINGINILREYKYVYKQNNWTKKKEYTMTSKFLKDFKNIKMIKTGAHIIEKEDIKKDYSINYKNFVKSRHSTRNYKKMKIKIEDIKEAIEMAKYTPSACNRQYIKLHYYPEGKMRQNIINYSIGKGGFYLDGVNTFIITFDVNGLNWSGERNQGYFNAGLFSMNLVNAFHSIGIGSCFIQFHNSIEEEEQLKQLNNIPSNERIAVILFAGYYDDKSIVTISQRKEFEHYFIHHLD